MSACSQAGSVETETNRRQSEDSAPKEDVLTHLNLVEVDHVLEPRDDAAREPLALQCRVQVQLLHVHVRYWRAVLLQRERKDEEQSRVFVLNSHEVNIGLLQLDGLGVLLFLPLLL